MGMALKRGIIIVFGLCAQICLYLFVYLFFINHVPVLHIFVDGLALLLALWLIKNSKNYSYTLPWLVIILLVPIVGALLYFILGYNKKNSKTLKSITKSEAKSKRYLVQNEKTKHEFRHNSKLRYITNYSGYPVTRNNDVVYYPLGEEAFEAMLKELKKAGYHFAGFWYEKPVSPSRYYEKVGFPEDACPVAVEVAEKIINVPTFYTEEQLAPALKIINQYVEKD